MSTALSTQQSGVSLYRRGDDLLQQAEDLGLHVGAKDRRMIIASGKKPVRDYPQGQLIEELKAFLVGIFHMLGIQKAPDQFEATSFMRAMVEWFPDMTLTDVRVAFEYHIMGELDKHVPPKTHHFQQFSFDYYAKVLKGYKQKQREAMHDLNGQVQVMLLEDKRYDPAQKGAARLGMLRLLRDLSMKYLLTGVDEFIVNDILIRLMKRLRFIPGATEPTMQDLMQAAAKEARGLDNSVHSSYKKLIEAGSAPDNIHNRATMIATRRSILAGLTEAGEDLVNRRFEWAITDCIDRYKLMEDETVPTDGE